MEQEVNTKCNSDPATGTGTFCRSCKTHQQKIQGNKALSNNVETHYATPKTVLNANGNYRHGNIKRICS